jgi:hypothetical protein
VVGHGCCEREPESELRERNGGGGEVDAEEVARDGEAECLVARERLF